MTNAIVTLSALVQSGPVAAAQRSIPGRVGVTSLPERSDEELMSLLQRNVSEALGALYDRHHRLVLALAYRILGDRAAAEEVVQEAFLSVWQQARTYHSDRGGARTWLLSIARHRAIDQVRRASKGGQAAEL